MSKPTPGPQDAAPDEVLRALRLADVALRSVTFRDTNDGGRKRAAALDAIRPLLATPSRTQQDAATQGEWCINEDNPTEILFERDRSFGADIYYTDYERAEAVARHIVALHNAAATQQEAEALRERFELLRRAVNESTTECSPGCDSWGHDDACKSMDPAAWLIDQQREIERLRAHVRTLSAPQSTPREQTDRWERREAIVQALHKGLAEQRKRGGDPLPAWLSVSWLTDFIEEALSATPTAPQSTPPA